MLGYEGEGEEWWGFWRLGEDGGDTMGLVDVLLVYTLGGQHSAYQHISISIAWLVCHD